MSLIAALLFFLAVGYNGWKCGPSILSGPCTSNVNNPTTGALLLCAGFVIFLEAILYIFVTVTDSYYVAVAATFVVGFAAILGMAGVFYYYHNEDPPRWSPTIAIMGMSISVTLACMTLYDFAAGTL